MRRGKLQAIVLALGVSALSLSPVWAEWRPYTFLNNAGGLNDGFDSTAIADNEASALQNVVFTTGGAIRKRQGFSEINTTALGASATATAATFYRQANGTRFLVALISNGVSDGLYKMDYGAGITGPDGTWDNITGALAIAITDDQHGDMAIARDSVVIEDGVNSTPPYVWAGSGNATALGGSPPNATMVETHKDFLWLAGSSAAPSQLAFSNRNTLTTWTGTDTIDVETSDGQSITGLKSGLDCLYVWKQESIWRVCGTNRDDFTLEQMVRGVGTCSNASIAVINNQFLFLTCRGDVAIYDGGITVQILSTKIEGTLSTLNQDRFDESVAAAFDDGTGDDDYYLCLSGTGAGTHNVMLVFDTYHRAWTKFAGINCNALFPYEVGTLQQALGFWNYAGRAMRYPNTESDDGAAINSFYSTKQFSFPDLPQDKTWRLLEVFVNQESSAYNLTTTVRTDFEGAGTASAISLAGSGAAWDSAVYDVDIYADVSTAVGRIEVNKRRRFCQARFENNGAGQPYTIRGFSLWIEPEARF